MGPILQQIDRRRKLYIARNSTLSSRCPAAHLTGPDSPIDSVYGFATTLFTKRSPLFGADMKKPSVLIIFLTVFIDLIGFGIVVPLIPVYSRHFGAHGFVIGVIIASFSAMQFVFSPIWGRLSDN